MIYALLRAVAGIALRWFYRGIQVEGAEKIPRRRPLLLVVNHPNALVDALLVGWIMPRRVLITAKATLFANPVAARLLRWIGVVPLQRAADLRRTNVAVDPSLNRETFRAVFDALARHGVVLIFPEGKSHDEPSLAPLKTGAARMALEAVNSGAATELAIVPIGLVFERKEAPRSRVLIQIGEPILVEEWRETANSPSVDVLTAEIETRLRAVTLNYANTDDVARSVRLASTIAALFDDAPPIGSVGRGLGVDTAIAKRIDDLSTRLVSAGPTVRARADTLVRRLDSIERVAAKHGVLLEDVGISLDAASATRFVIREGWIVSIGVPVLVWGRINHWLPFRAARAVALHSVESAADPAMRTIIAGSLFVLLTYLAQTAAADFIWGPPIAAAYLVSLPIAAEINFALSDRMRRALQRARAFRRFRRDPALQHRLQHELALLRNEILAFESELGNMPVAATA
jgi:1-acyl-sn-glycerol-3-phosphate acyltransferase